MIASLEFEPFLKLTALDASLEPEYINIVNGPSSRIQLGLQSYHE